MKSVINYFWLSNYISDNKTRVSKKLHGGGERGASAMKSEIKYHQIFYNYYAHSLWEWVFRNHMKFSKVFGENDNKWSCSVCLLVWFFSFFFFSMEFEIKPLLFLGSNLYAYVFHKWSCLSFQEIAFFSSWFCFLFCGFCTWLTSTSLWSNGIEFESEPICLPWFMKRKRICLLLVKPSCCVHDLL